MRKFGRFIGQYGKRMKHQNLFGKTDSLLRVARSTANSHGGAASLAKKFGIKASLYGSIGIGAASYAGYKVSNFREGLVKGMFPGSVMPMEAGRFGVRTNTSPAGISGVKFNYKRSS